MNEIEAFLAAYWPWLGLAAVLFVLPLAYIGIEVAGAVLVGADGITPVRKTDRTDEARRPDVEEAGR